MSYLNKLSKALVLSLGGETGIAWEVGILWGLKEGGVDVTDVDLIIGTSAGSILGAQITSGISLEELYKFQLKPIEETKEKVSDMHKFIQIKTEAIKSTSDAQTARAYMGKAAFNVETMSEEEHLEIIASELPKKDWNQKIQLIVNTVDAETGKWVTFDKDSGVPLLNAVAAREILDALKGKNVSSEPDEKEEEELNVLKEDIIAKSQEFIKDKLSELDWEQLQELVAGLLRGMGYKTMVSAKGPDRGRDIIASPDGLGLREPRIVVEVKHRNGQMGASEIRGFTGGLRPGDLRGKQASKLFIQERS